MTNVKFVRNSFSGERATERSCKQQVVRWGGPMRARLCLVAGLCLFAGIPALAQTGQFIVPPRSYPTPAVPAALAIGDLKGDGKNDVVVATYTNTDNGPNGVSVFMGNGDGTFQPPVNYSTPNPPVSIALGDLNGDGKPDLVVVDPALGDWIVSVLLNNGDGTFQSPVNYSTAPGPLSVAIGDLNGDGKLDLAIACVDAVSILLGNGDGTFRAHVDYAAGSQGPIVLGDFNGDGRLDFAVMNNYELSVFLNNGGGSFTSTVTQLVNMFCYGMAAADFNGDGKLDLAVSSLWDSGGFEVFLGNGDGTFQQVFVLFPPGSGWLASAITTGDFNGDGIPDVVFGFAGSPSLFLGNGDGTFRFDSSYATGASYDTNDGLFAAADLNGDGRPDLVVGNGGLGCLGFPGGPPPPCDSSNTFTVLLNDGRVAAGFKLAASPGSQTVDVGSSGTFSITGTALNGFKSSVSLTCTGQPSGSSCNLTPTSVTPRSGGVSSTLTVTTSASTPVGTYVVMVTGTSGIVRHSIPVRLTIQSFAIFAPASLTPSSVMPGQSAKATVTVSPSAGFNGTVAFTCKVSPAPASAPVCSLNPAQVQVTNSGQATSTLTVSTTGPNAFLVRPILRHGGPPIYAMVFPIFGLALVEMCFRSGGTRKRLLSLTICCLLFGGLVFQAACGGGSTSTPGTPEASYTVSVTASSGSTQHTTSLMLTVQ